MTDTKIHIQIHGLAIGDDHPVRVMGVLNVSGESFYKKSVVQPKDIHVKAREMIDNGATMLDVGGRSTAPTAPSISVAEEKKRVEAALNALLPKLENDAVLISVDTQYKDVADYALKTFERHGMDEQFILNDVSGLHGDPELAPWIADVGKSVIIMASHEKPGDSLGIDQAINDLTGSIALLENLDYDTTQVIVDPAIGHWIPEKVPEYDLELLNRLQAFRSLGHCILVAISRKSFIGEILAAKPDDRFHGTLSATAIAVFNGAHVIRTHDVNKETIDVIKIAEAIKHKQLV
ncbi:MAG TPA: dihydropteroate synthase [Candidatus Lokiarchaeia archaeon]|nr:dihydropteroate synthase [Candidatus Lokiarchaeia archaeon]